MKKIFGISAIFLVIGLIIGFVVGFVNPIPVVISQKSVFTYKLLSSLEFFFKFLPGILITGYIVSCAVYFGHNSEGSVDRFSKAMFNRFNKVMITSLVCTCLLTFGNEIFGVLIKQKKNNIENRTKLINEYVSVGNRLFEQGFYNRSMYYADAALKLDPASKEAMLLKDNSDVEINRQNNANYRFKLYETVNNEMKSVNKVNIDGTQILDVYKCYALAQGAFEQEQWFDAHYYAQMGIDLATPKDPNLKLLQVLSTSAWNNLTQQHKLSKNQNQKDFEKKYEGYLALAEKDDLKAYYIFNDLAQTSFELSKDPDVIFYLQVAENRVKEKYFFIDETIELNSFENSSDIYFSLNYRDGSKDIIYFKGMKNVGQTGKSIQYVRNLTVKSLAKNGELFRTMTVPYAKILPVEVKSMNSTTKMLMEIDDSVDYVPYIMLNSVGREEPNSEIKPLYVDVKGEVSTTPEYLLLPISFSDFLMIESSNSNPEMMTFFTLLTLVGKADKYGFATEVYEQNLFDRMFYPIFLLILFIFLAIVAWNNRVGSTQLFKMSWVISFPFIFAIATALYYLVIFVFHLLNYALLASTSSLGVAIIGACLLYVSMLIVCSVRFVSLKTTF